MTGETTPRGGDTSIPARIDEAVNACCDPDTRNRAAESLHDLLMTIPMGGEAMLRLQAHLSEAALTALQEFGDEQVKRAARFIAPPIYGRRRSVDPNLGVSTVAERRARRAEQQG